MEWRKVGYRRAVKLIGEPRICGLCERIFPPELKKPMTSTAQYPDQPTVGHITPRSKGGKDTADNLRWECLFCNQAKGDIGG